MLTERYPRALTYSAGIHVWHHSVGGGSMADLLSASALVLQATGDEDSRSPLWSTTPSTPAAAPDGSRTCAPASGTGSLQPSPAAACPMTRPGRRPARSGSGLPPAGTAEHRDSDSLLVLVAVATVEARALAAAGPAQRVNDDLRADYLAASRLMARERPLPTVLAAAFDQAVDGLHTTV